MHPPPSWRHDIYREIDLVEEVARSHGYDKIPTADRINIEVAAVDKREKLTCQLRTFLNGCGFYEALNITFTDDKTAAFFADDNPDEHLAVKDASRKSANLLRQNLMGALLGVMRSNYNVKNIPCRLYEIANTFKPSTDDLPVERTKVAIATDDDFRTLRGTIEGLIRTADSNAAIDLIPTDLNWASAGANVIVNENSIGICGIVSANVADHFNLKETSVAIAEIDFDALLDISGNLTALKPIPRFPAVTRDLSLIVDENITWAAIVETIKRKRPAELEDVNFTGIYRGKPIPAGQKSITISLRFRDEDGTLTHEVVDKFETDILAELTGSLRAKLRTA